MLVSDSDDESSREHNELTGTGMGTDTGTGTGKAPLKADPQYAPSDTSESGADARLSLASSSPSLAAMPRQEPFGVVEHVGHHRADATSPPGLWPRARGDTSASLAQSPRIYSSQQ